MNIVTKKKYNSNRRFRGAGVRFRYLLNNNLYTFKTSKTGKKVYYIDDKPLRA